MVVVSRSRRHKKRLGFACIHYLYYLVLKKFTEEKGILLFVSTALVPFIYFATLVSFFLLSWLCLKEQVFFQTLFLFFCWVSALLVYCCREPPPRQYQVPEGHRGRYCRLQRHVKDDADHSKKNALACTTDAMVK